MSETKYVAIVDDHTMIRKGLVSLVNMFPQYKVLFDAANGSEFIDRLKPLHLPDIVLLDIQMPEMDGYATAEWIRINHPSIKVLTLSAMDSENTIIKMIRHGAKGYILKDAAPEELQRAFNEVLAHGYFYNEQLTGKLVSSIHRLADTQSSLHGFVHLSDREREFIQLACSEKTYQQIANEMFLSERTIDGYRESAFKKLGVATRVGLVIYAIKHGLVAL